MKGIDSAVEVYLGLGTNLGDRKANISEALKRLDDAFGCGCSALSGFYETEPWGFESEDRFLNAAVRYDIALSPEEILGIPNTARTEKESIHRESLTWISCFTGRKQLTCRT